MYLVTKISGQKTCRDIVRSLRSAYKRDKSSCLYLVVSPTGDLSEHCPGLNIGLYSTQPKTSRQFEQTIVQPAAVRSRRWPEEVEGEGLGKEKNNQGYR